MSITLTGQYQSFQVSKVDENISPQNLRKSLNHNDKVDIVYENNHQLYVLSGDKVDLKELSGKLPHIAKSLQIFDRNQDGALVEDELKYDYAESNEIARTEAYQDIEEAGSFKENLLAVAFPMPALMLPVMTTGLGLTLGSKGAVFMEGAKVLTKGGVLGAAAGLAVGMGLIGFIAHDNENSTRARVLSDSYQERQINNKMDTYKTPDWVSSASFKTAR